MNCYWLLLLITVLSCNCLEAQNTIVEIIPTAYDIKNGLSDNNINDGLLDQNNVLWLASNNGLSCFDGQHFINFHPSDSLLRLSDKSVQSLALIGNTVYAATNKGIDAIDIHSKKSRLFYKAAQQENIVVLFATKKNELIYITLDGLCKNLNTQQKLQLPFKAANYFVAENDQENIYISTFQNHFYSIHLPTHKVSSYIKKRDQANYGLVFSSKLGLLSLYYNGLFSNNIETKKEDTAVFYPANFTGFTEIDTGSYLTIHEYSRIFYKFNYNRPATEIKILQTRNAIFKKLLVDRYGTVIILTNSGIFCFRLPLPYFQTVPDNLLQPNLGSMVRRGMLETPDQKIRLFSYNGIQQYDPITKNTTIFFEKRRIFYTAIQDKNKYWIATDGIGLLPFNIKQQTLDPSIRFDSTLQSEHIFSMCATPNDNILLGYLIPFGLREFNPRTYSIKDIPFNYGKIIPAQSRISHISRDINGHYWIATDKGVFELDENYHFLMLYNAVEGKPDQHLPNSYVNYIHHLNDHSLWAATDNGIALLNTKNKKIEKIFTSKQNIPEGKCVSILEDNYHRLWVATYKGLSVIDPVNGIINNYFKEDGLPDDEYNYAASLKTSNGNLYFGGLNGILKIDPDLWRPQQAKTTLHFALMQIEKDKGTQLLSPPNAETNSISITRNEAIFEILFGFSEYVNPNFCKYWYKIEGFNKDWISLGYNGRIQLWNLPAGYYTILLKGSNGKDNTASADLRIALTVNEPFYQTGIFKILMVLLIIGIIIVILFQRNHEYKAIRSIKKHMLNDIHDEVGSILTKTAMKAEVLNLKMGNQVKDLQDIQQYSREAIQSLRNLLWSISSENMATTDFQDRVNDWLQFIFADTGYEFHFNNLIPENRFTNNVTVRRNIVLIIKELAHNCLKHAHGDQFNITLNMKENKYQLVVTDNGKNENNEILSKGYGLKSIESRVTQIKGKVIFQKTIEGFKTEIIF